MHERENMPEKGSAFSIPSSCHTETHPAFVSIYTLQNPVVLEMLPKGYNIQQAHKSADPLKKKLNNPQTNKTY